MQCSRFALIVGLMLSLVGPAFGSPTNPTFTKDVAPILFNNCSSCHRPNEVGPFPLLTYTEAKKRAKQMADVTHDKIMPPWKPVAGPDVFKNARTLTDEQIAVFKAWAEAGAPFGELKEMPAQPKFPEGWHAGKPDMILKVARPFTIPAEGPDIYVHFVLPLNFDRDMYVKAVQVLPSNRKVAHHGVIILDGSGTARKLAMKNGGDHYPNFGGPGFLPAGFLPGYAPGQTTRIEKSDKVSIVVKKGADIVLQMHYHPIGKEVTDQPQIGLYFTDKKPERNINIIGMANNDVYIPAGERYKRTDSFTLPVDFEVGNIWGHMHMIGREVKVWAALPDGKTRDMLLISDWDFNWQDTYLYKKPFILPKGTVVKAEWTWENTADNPRNPNTPPKLIKWGEGSTDEMSGLIIGGLTVEPKDEGPMWIPVILHYLEIEQKAHDAAKKRETTGAMAN
jgi:mono/diheme cytochrome c family protein